MLDGGHFAGCFVNGKLDGPGMWVREARGQRCLSIYLAYGDFRLSLYLSHSIMLSVRRI